MKQASNIKFIIIFSFALFTGCDENSEEATSYTGITGDEQDRMPTAGIEHVVHISVDGLHPMAITTLGEGAMPNFYYLQNNGSYTHNARTDAMVAFTLPNHTSQFTGRPVLGMEGHGYFINDDLEFLNITLHNFKGDYITSVFDMVHDFGLSTALYTGKSKFSIFQDSWDGLNGAADRVLPDSGHNKIDKYVFEADTRKLVDMFIEDLEVNSYNYAFLHLKDADIAGHAYSWSLELGSEYLNAVEGIDSYIGDVVAFIDSNSNFSNSTVLIITADHSGQTGEVGHVISRENGLLESAVIPFYIYGPNVSAATDLYNWNPNLTVDPINSHPFFNNDQQPIRNGDVANLVMDILGLPNVTGSTIDNLDFPN